MKWFSSDLHLSHNRIITEEFSNRPFSSIEEMNEVIINNMIAPLKKGDDFYFLGDLSWSGEATNLWFDKLPRGVRFHWILGNHDEKMYKSYEHLCTSVSRIKEIKIGKTPTTLCHYPMLTWNKSHYDSFMLFGHHHINGHGTLELESKTQGKMLNVNCEFNNYKPYSEDDILRIMQAKGNNWDSLTKKYSTLELDFSPEQYLQINELARAKGLLLDNYINMVLREEMEKYDNQD